VQLPALEQCVEKSQSDQADSERDDRADDEVAHRRRQRLAVFEHREGFIDARAAERWNGKQE